MSNGAMYIKDYEQHCGSLGKSFKGYTVAKAGKQLVYEKRNKSLKQNKAAHVIAGPLLAQHLIDGSVTIMRQRKKRKQAVHYDPCSPESQGAKFILFQAPFKVGKYFPKITVRKFIEMLTKDWNKVPTETRCAVNSIWKKKMWKMVVNIPGVMTSKTDGSQPKTYGEWLKSIDNKIVKLDAFSTQNDEQKSVLAGEDKNNVPYEFEGNNFWTQEDERGVALFLGQLRTAAQITFMSQLWKMARNGARSSKVSALARDIKDFLTAENMAKFGKLATDKVISDPYQVANGLIQIRKQLDNKGKKDACELNRGGRGGRGGRQANRAALAGEEDMEDFDNLEDAKDETKAEIMKAKASLSAAKKSLAEAKAAEDIDNFQRLVKKFEKSLQTNRSQAWKDNYKASNSGMTMDQMNNAFELYLSSVYEGGSDVSALRSEAFENPSDDEQFQSVFYRSDSDSS